jgi:hypothetical protein
MSLLLDIDTGPGNAVFRRVSHVAVTRKQWRAIGESAPVEEAHAANVFVVFTSPERLIERA